MAISFNKRENEKKKQQKRQEKQKKKEGRKISGKSSSFDDMIAYVDENGMITSTPPDLQNKEVIDQEQIQISVPRKEKEEAPMRKGRVDHYAASKGYGFIKDMNGSEQYFFHISNAPEDIEEGSIVTYDLEKGNKGMNAVNITFVNEGD